MSEASALVGSDAREILRGHFGFRSFRHGQGQAVQHTIEGRDTIVLMPTGSGKSLCFQIPALALPGMTVVVSPLISLMKDQADALRKKGAGVVTMNSALSAAERRETEEAIRNGEVEFVYTTPERLADAEFRDLLRTQEIDLLVVDEAHCLSQWGHDFRPAYLSVGSAITDLGRPPILALTATATEDVLDDIKRRLRIPDAEVVHTGFDRPNLEVSVIRIGPEIDRKAVLFDLLCDSEGMGIVYVPTVRAIGELVGCLSSERIEVLGYHGRMKVAERAANQDRFMAGSIKAIVATNAFGLGIDKPDIRFVLHYRMPGTLEAYYQETGRAGRDGRPARGILLHETATRSSRGSSRAVAIPPGKMS